MAAAKAPKMPSKSAGGKPTGPGSYKEDMSPKNKVMSECKPDAKAKDKKMSMPFGMMSEKKKK